VYSGLLTLVLLYSGETLRDATKINDGSTSGSCTSASIIVREINISCYGP
jgi:hypothetical protein